MNDPNVVTAYINYISWLIDQLQPVFVNYGVESNFSRWNASACSNYRDFISKVYPQLKSKYPLVPFFIRFIVDESAEGYRNAQQLVPYTDYIELSAYPYVTVSSSANGSTNPVLFADNYFKKFINLDAKKPLGFAETSYKAEDLTVPAYSLDKQGNTDWQKSYLEFICQFCNKHKAAFLIWFCSKDYDAGNNTLRRLGLYRDLFSFSEDTGLLNENGTERPAFTSWVQWMKKKRIK